MTKKSIRNKSKRDKLQDYLSNIYDVGGAINISEWYNLNKNLNSPQLSLSGLPSSYETGIKYGNNNTNNNQGGLSGDVNWNQVGNVALGALLSGTSGIIGNAIGGGKTSGVGSGISNIGSTVGGALSAVNPILGGVVSLGSNVLGGGINALFGSDLNEERIALALNEINKAKSFNANASNFDDLSLLIASLPIIAGFSQSDIGSDGLFSNKAKNKYRDLLAQKLFAESWKDRSIANNVTNLQLNQMNNLLTNYAAYGGGIHIAPSKRGTFTAAAKKHGKGVQEFASLVLANKENYSPTMVKKANFARNSTKFKHAFGGDLLTNGTVFSNNVNIISNGNSHEDNIYGGVQVGVDPQGIPNLVEEGETIWNDYVFSNRILVPNAVRNKYKLRGTKDMSFSDAAKKILKASEERPNDPIAQDTLDINLSRLALEQETIRELKNMNNKNTFKKGGPKKSKIPAFTLTIGKDDFIDPRLDKAQLALSNPLGLTKDDFAEVGMVDKDPYENITFNNNHNNNNNNYATWLRYAPVLGSTLGLSLTLLSSPNYSRADALALYAQNAGKITPISYDPIDTMLTYKPVDLNYIANRMAALAAATRRNIMNTSGGNRANAIGSLLAADYNALIALADAIRQGEDTNWNRLMQTQTFNRGTKQTNAEMALKAAMANQEARLKASQLGLSGYTTAMQMKDAIDALRNASINANLSSLFESLGNIGVDEYNRMDRDMLIKSGVFGTLNDAAKRAAGIKSSKGGKLNKKKRGGFTY